MGRTGAYLSVWQLVGSNGNMGDTLITHFYFLFTQFIFYLPKSGDEKCSIAK